jgi:Uma2 family endonuclease
VEEYLNTCYRPDCGYVEGRLVERNVGERDHSRLQARFIIWLGNRETKFGIHVYVEQRVQVSADRFRVPDICIVAGADPEEQIFTKPPHICIEILSKDDTLESMQDRIDDYLRFGVPHVWLLNPRNRRAWECSPEGIREVKDGILRARDPEVVAALAETFEDF